MSDGKGTVYYFDHELRKQCLSDKLDYEPDSHTSIAHYKGKDEDELNKYEYNPLTKKFQTDQLNATDDSKKVERFCRNLDFSTVVPELLLKPIFHPFEQRSRKRVSQIDIALVREWASVWGSVWTSVRASLRASVGDSVGDSVWASVRASVRAYIGGLFPSIPSWKYAESLGLDPWRPLLRLWYGGYVPSYDGKVWRLHAGPKAEVVYELKG